MAIFNTSGDRLGVPTLTDTNTVAQLALGTVVRGYNDVSATNGEFIYVQAGEAIAEGEAVAIDLHNKVTKVSTTQANSGKPVGFAIGALANNDYGFVQISGKVKAKCNAAVVADAKVMLTAVAGAVDDAAVAGSQIIGAEFATADGTPAANYAYVNLGRPAIQTQIT